MFKYRLYHRRRSSPLWWVGIGRETRVATGTADEEAAHLFAQALAERLWRERKLGDRSAVPFGETAEKWLTDTASDKSTDAVLVDWLLGRSQSNLVDAQGQPVPNLTHEPVSAVAEPAVWEQLRKAGKAMGWSLSSIDRMMTTVSAVLNFAQRRGALTNKVSVPKYVPPQGEPRFLSPQQFAQLYPELPEHTQRAARFGAATLLRMRAMLSLEWSAVDLQRRVAWIAARHQKNGKTFTFPLSDAAVEVLEEIRTAQRLEYAAYVKRHAARYARSPSHPLHGGIPKAAPDRVFTYRLKPIDDLNTAAFKLACARAGVPWCTWHILSRHTGASWATQNGVSLEQRMKLGGWTDMRMAMRYSHLEDTHVAAAAQTVGQMLHQALIVKSVPEGKKRA